MRKEAKITLTMFVVLGGVVTWYAWIGGDDGGDLALDSNASEQNSPLNVTTDAPATSGRRPIATSPLRSEPILVDDSPNETADLLADLGIATGQSAQSQQARSGKRGRRRPNERSGRASGHSTGSRLDTILASIEPAASADQPTDRSADVSTSTIGQEGDETSQPRRADESAAEIKKPRTRTSPAETSRRSAARADVTWNDTDQVYVVAGGDTLAILAEVHYGSQRYAEFLAQANPQVEDPRRLMVGTRLRIPVLPASMARKIRTATKTVASTDSPNQSEATTRGETYVVQTGDSLYQIAATLWGQANRWPEIHEYNRTLIGDDPTDLKVGQRLRIPPRADSR